MTDKAKYYELMQKIDNVIISLRSIQAIVCFEKENLSNNDTKHLTTAVDEVHEFRKKFQKEKP